VDRRMVPNNFLDIVRRDIFPRHDDQVFLTSNGLEFSVVKNPHISRPIPAVLQCLCSQIGAIVLTPEQGIAA
jgi:hypothetical protein